MIRQFACDPTKLAHIRLVIRCDTLQQMPGRRLEKGSEREIIRDLDVVNMNESEIASNHAIAEQHCNRGDSDCRWYHANWHLLKALGIVSTSAIHERSIARLLKLAIGHRTTPRILLTGSTDESLLRVVHSACQKMAIAPQLTALDLCATPLVFMQNFATGNQINLATVQADIFDFAPAEQFDIIITHAFMGNFDAARRHCLVRKWNELLHDRGNVVTIQRIRSADSPDIVEFSDQQATDFVKTALSAARDLGLSQESDLLRVKEAAGVFARKFTTHAIRSKAELRELFLDAGMRLDCLSYHKLDKRAHLSGPSVPSAGEYAHIVARKSAENGCGS